jgi:hypothetical protein
MPVLHSRLGDWELDHVHEWSRRELVIRAPERPLIGPTTKVATIGSCFASELAAMMGTVGIVGGMHPGGLFYSTATIRQEMERFAGGWHERADEALWRVGDGFVDPFRSYDDIHPDEATLRASRQAADGAADTLFRDARVVVATLGLIETWLNPATRNTYRQIPHPAVFRELAPEFHRLTVAEMLDDLERIRTIVRDRLGAELVVTTSPVPLHSTFTELDVRVANVESKSRIRAAVSEFVDRHSDVHYFHSYEMVVTAGRQSDYYREDGRHVHRHAVRYVVSEFLRLYGTPEVQLADVDSSWLTPITQTAPTPKREPRPAAGARPRPTPATAAIAPAAVAKPMTAGRIVRGIRRRARAILTRSAG